MTRVRLTMLAVIAALAGLVGSPAMAGETAPTPAKPVDPARLYSGRWLEIARLPMSITKGCVAATTDYVLDQNNRVTVTEACHARTPSGSLRSITSPGRILDPGVNAKLRVSYPLFISWDFWILDHADDYGWFISGDPAHERLFIFTREVPDAATLSRLVERARALGYDASRLEFPQVAPASNPP
jgi:apolipoprotein D and lipocalin family protein